MNDEQLKTLFERAAGNEPQPKPEAKARALTLAMEAFEQADDVDVSRKGRFLNVLKKITFIFQGNRLVSRLMGNTNPKDSDMNLAKSQWLYGGAATAMLAVFAVLIVVKAPHEPQLEEGLSEPDVFSETEVRGKGRTIDSSAEQLPVRAPVDAKLEAKKSDIEGATVAQTEAFPSAPRAAEPVHVLEDIQVRGASAKERVSNRHEVAERIQSLDAEDVGGTVGQEISQALSSVTGVSIHAKPAAKMKRGKVARLFSDGEGRSSVLPESSGDVFSAPESNGVKQVRDEPVSTFSIDVDTASYSYVRSSLNNGVLPPKSAVRIEEMLNYFPYAYPAPKSETQPFVSHTHVLDSPWSKGKKLLHIGIKGYELKQKPKSNLVFLLDVSGSMGSPDKLPLVKQSMQLLLSQLNDEDHIAIVVYAGAAGTVLEPTQVKQSEKILAALNHLHAGGSTAGAKGIELAYQLAERHFDKNAVNRILLATDGDFNVGINDMEQLKGFIERKRDKGIFLSVLGFGRGNYQDALMQTLAQNGNGIAAYIDSLSEAQKVLVDEATSTLFPIAKDVKIQVEFNPNTVSEYRLIGYETRVLKREDFNNDKVDAGDIGAGHSVTAIYEFTPSTAETQSVDSLRYQTEQKAKLKKDTDTLDEYAFIKLRYKLPKQDTSSLITQPVPANNTAFESVTLKQEVQFALAVAGFAQLLKGESHLEHWGYEDALTLAQNNKGKDVFGYRAEFTQLIRKAMLARDL